MKPLYSQSEFENSRSTDNLKIQCEYCNSIFERQKRHILQHFKGNPKQQIKYCSRQCFSNSRNKSKKTICNHCNVEFVKQQHSLNERNFCSHSCAAKYSNSHKTKGTRRSKLEMWLESQLKNFFPNLVIEYNQQTIGAELDIYIPSLQIAFELNGIFHYEPIFGSEKLNRIKTNDSFKLELCYKHRTDLCIIDTSQQKYFKPKTSKIYLDIIINIVKDRLSTFSQK